MNSPCGKPQGITSTSLRFADNKECSLSEKQPCGEPQEILKLNGSPSLSVNLLSTATPGTVQTITGLPAVIIMPEIKEMKTKRLKRNKK